MGKKVREYKSGDFIFAKVKGYPAWPARVQRLNGKKYFVYFYGTGETANLPPNMIFDYAENKDKFLTKTQKRRDFNDGVKQIEHDFANNVPLEEVIGVPMEVSTDTPANDTVNDSAVNDTMNETADTTANDTVDDDANTTQNDATVEDSDENGALVIDEGKASKKKAKADAVKTPAKETPKAKEPKTPRGKAKKDETKKDDDKSEDNDKQEEIVSRSGRKIRPKRFVDEHTEDNSTLPSPAPKKKRGASPLVEKDKPEPKDKNINSFNAVRQSELEDLKQPFKPEDPDKENILIAYLPSGKYVGIKLFQSRPVRFKNESTRLQWDKQAASNAITLKMQLERGQITALSVQGQLVMDLNLTDEDKTTLDKERETEEKKSRVQFLKTEMKLIELDAKIKTCLSLEKADAELCIQLLDELMALDVKPLMLLKHPACLETIKRMRAYIGNTPSWDLSENAALLFSKQAHRIRKLADVFYKNIKELFTTPDGLSFWEFFSERVLQFKKVSSKLSACELLEMVHEPIEMSQPTSHTMTAAIDAANNDSRDDEPTKKKSTPAKPKKTANNNTPIVTKGKRQSSRKQTDAENEDKDEEINEDTTKDTVETTKETETPLPELTEDVEMAEATKETENQTVSDKDSEAPLETGKNEKSKDSKKNKPKEGKKSLRNIEKNARDAEKANKDTEKKAKETDESSDQTEKGTEINNDNEKGIKDDENAGKDAEIGAEAENSSTNEEHSTKDNESSSKNAEPTLNYEAASNAETTTKDDEKTETEEKKSPKKGSKETPKEDKTTKEPEKSTATPEKNLDETETNTQEPQTSDAKVDVKEKSSNKKDDKKKADKNAKESKETKDSEKGKESEKRKADDDKTKEDIGEPRAKRSRETRESKKTEVPPPRSPAKRKSKN